MKFYVLITMGWVMLFLDKRIKRALRKRYAYNKASVIHSLILITVFISALIIDICR